MTDDSTTDSGNAVDETEWKLAGRTTSRRNVLRGGLAASAALGLGLTGAASTIGEEHDDGDADEWPASVAFRNQFSDGETVTVESVTVPEGGYVTIHDGSLLDGEVVDSVIGVSEYLESGTSENVEVDLFDIIGAEFDQSELEETQPLIAMPHRETNDNEEYNFVGTDGDADGAYVRDGQAVVDAGYAILEDESPEDATPTETPEDATPEAETASGTPEADEEASVTLRNQTTDGSVADIASVTLPEGGYVTIHDASLLTGAVVDSVIGVSGYLDPGRFVDGEIPLYEVPGAEFDQSELDETQVLIAMPHQETNDNEEYDFVETDGETDGPYVQGGQPVISAAFAVIEDTETVTPEDETETTTPAGNETA